MFGDPIQLTYVVWKYAHGVTLTTRVPHLEGDICKNWLKCNQSTYNYMQLLVCCDYVWIVLQLFLVLVIFAIALQLVYDHFGFHPST